MRRDSWRSVPMIPGVLLGVENLVRQLLLVEVSRQQFGILDRRGADQNRLLTLVAVLGVADDRIYLFLEGAKDQVVLVGADHRQVSRDHHGFEMVDLLELEGLGIGGSRHAGQPLVHTEVVLERDRCQRLVLALDRHTFLRLDGLMQPIGPAPADHQATGELVHDDHFAVLHHILLVAMVERVRAQRRVQVVHQGDIVRVVQAHARRQQLGFGQNVLRVFVPGFREKHLMRLLVDPVVTAPLLLLLPLQFRRNVVQAVVELDVVVRLPRDDERSPRLVDQDRVHFVDDRVVEPALDPLGGLEHHVVAQVVEAELVVGAVGDVRRVRSLLVGMTHLRQVDADGEPEEAIDASHPVRVALGEVIVDRDDVHAPSAQGVEICRKRSDERLALAGLHFSDLAVVQHHAADELHVEDPHLQRSLPRLPDDGERFRQHGVKLLAVADALAQRDGTRAQLVVGERRRRRLQGVDLADDLSVLLEQALVTAAEYFGKNVGDHFSVTDAAGCKKQGVRIPSPLPIHGAFFRGQLADSRNRAGFWGTPFKRTSKCRCGPVARPVEPTAATF